MRFAYAMAKTHGYGNVLQLILAAYKHKGQLPALAAVSTIYYGMLSSSTPVNSDEWQLFTHIAALPLRTQRLEASCVANGEPCKRREVSGHCAHATVEVPHTVQLASSDQWLLETGKERNGVEIHYWGKPLAQALGASYQGLS